MKNAARHKIAKTFIFFLITLFSVVFSGCGGEADTITPSEISVSTPGSVTGTVYPQIISVYPDGSTNPQVDTQIVIVFSKPIAIGTVAANISITPATSYTESLACGGYAVVLQPSSDLLYSQNYNVTILTGIQDSVNGYNLSVGGTFSFTTASSTAPAERPRVITATRFPSGSTVSKSLQYAEVTFTESVDNVDGYFTISPDIASGSPVTSDNKTWQLPLNTPSYGTTYTVTLTTDIYKLGDASSLLYDAGNLTWTFQMESDPTSAAYTFTDIWVESVTATTATIKYTSSKPIIGDYSRAQAGITSGTYTINNIEGGVTGTTVHTVILTGLTPGETYFYRGWLDVDGSGTETINDVYSTEYSFMTANDATVNSILTNAANNQDGLVLLQTNSTGSYAFWVDNGSEIYGQYFTSAAQWAAGGLALSTGSTQTGIIAITDGFAEAVIVYNDSNSLYAKMVDATGLKASWGYAAGDAGDDLGLTIKAGSTYSACIVHERPDIITSGTANNMPLFAANLIYDADVNFSIYNAWLNLNDLMVIDPGGGSSAWTSYMVNDQSASPFDIFPYALRTTGATGLGTISDYYIADAGVTVTGTADVFTFQDQVCSTATNLLLVVAGDIITTSDGDWGIVSAPGGQWSGTYFFVDIDRNLANLGGSETFTIYTNHAGPFTSEAVTNPLWDTAPSTLFNPGATVLAGDFVVNENNGAGFAAATSGTVSAITVADTDYALQLTALINPLMADGDIYSIVRLPTGATGVAVGYSTSFATDFNFTDTHNPFAAVSTGDIVFNIDKNLSAMVTNVGSTSSLTLSADIFNTNIYDKAIIYTKRGFLVTCVNASDYIVARAFNLADGNAIGVAFNVCTAGTNSNPVAVSDGAGNAIIFYEKGGSVYAKKVSAKGEFVWTDAAASGASVAGIQVTAAAGYTIVQALPDRSTGASSATGGAYLLVDSGAGSIRLIHVSGDTGTTQTTLATIAGYDPQMVVDYDSGTYNRAIIVYRIIHTAIYYHIEARCYRAPSTTAVWSLTGASSVSSNSALYSCYKPSITMADNTAAADGFYISWFDGRYFNPCGYSIYAQRYTSTPVVQWTPGGEFVSMPASMGYDHTLYMRLLYWDDGGAPYGILPVWLDYRTDGTTGTDIYYQKIDNSLTFVL